MTESVPRRQARIWELGEVTPGVSMVTVLDQPGHLSQAEFLHKWTTAHTPLSLAWLPLVGYVRNHVVRPLDADAPSAAGIVLSTSPTWPTCWSPSGSSPSWDGPSCWPSARPP